MTKSIKAQKLFLRLFTNQRKRWINMPRYSGKNNWNKKFPAPHRVKVEIINAVTGERTTAYALEDSKRALKKWLRIRNIRAQFESMKLKPNSSWFHFTLDEFKDFPIIVKIQEAQFPYVIDHTGEKITIKNKTTCSIFLRAADNIDYLGIVNQKKDLMKDWIKEHPVKNKKKAKRKKKSLDFDD